MNVCHLCKNSFVRIPELLVSCQSQLYQWLQKYWAVQVGGQENRWPTIPSTKVMPWLLTAQPVLAVSTGVISGFLPKSILKYKMSLYFRSNTTLSWQQPAQWLGFSVDFFSSAWIQIMCTYAIFQLSIHKWSSCIKSDLVRVYNTVHLHNSTFFSTTFSSANIFHASKLLVHSQENRYFQ